MNEEKNKETVASWNEIYKVHYDKEKEEVIVEEIQVEDARVSAGKIAKCDLCNVNIGKYKDLKYIIEPEIMTKAIRAGLKPQGESMALLKNFGMEELVIKNWKKMAMASETPWALCDKCYAELYKMLSPKNVMK